MRRHFMARRDVSPARVRFLVALFLTALAFAPTARAESAAATRPAGDRVPTLFLIGDSTVKNHTAGLQGWGDPVADFFDPAKIRVENRARAAAAAGPSAPRGSGTRCWPSVKPGDFVLIQFGHNDGGPPRRAPRPGLAQGQRRRDEGRHRPRRPARPRPSTPTAGTCGSTSPTPKPRARRRSCSRRSRGTSGRTSTGRPKRRRLRRVGGRGRQSRRGRLRGPERHRRPPLRAGGEGEGAVHVLHRRRPHPHHAPGPRSTPPRSSRG